MKGWPFNWGIVFRCKEHGLLFTNTSGCHGCEGLWWEDMRRGDDR